ncbi:hypothetical protein [Nocardioides sp.]|uniref:hypothetical protein n=1 Tax=Nocardioides sp. TaxID=35761 RepID=UPI00261821B5|nr:hypothetical protein [Nocardioides sp.]MDI6911493.1 hypothetical protein [Nocardioides sp.]
MNAPLGLADLQPPEEIEELIAQLPVLDDGAEPAPYPHAEILERDAQDDLDELGAPGDAPHTSREAVQLGWEWVRGAVFLGVGYCLKVIRSLFLVDPLYPDAETGWEQAGHRHKTDDTDQIPWGVPVWWVNGRHGHIALSLGKGRCLTTDYVRTGYLGLARIEQLGPWCGGRLVGWSADVNGVVVWRRKAKPEKWDIDDRIAFVRAALQRAIANDAPEIRVRGLRSWLKQLRARRDKLREQG